MDPVLYILMRTDMDSMNPGKGMAQAAHAANQFAHFASGLGFDAWVDQGGTFGTTIVLAVASERDLKKRVKAATDHGFEAGIVHDSTYPVRDGDVTHLIPVDTCGWVFSPDRKDYEMLFLADLELHP